MEILPYPLRLSRCEGIVQWVDNLMTKRFQQGCFIMLDLICESAVLQLDDKENTYLLTLFTYIWGIPANPR